MAAVRVLGRADRGLAAALVDADPVVHSFVASRLDAGVLEPHIAGELWGYPAERPRALVHVGAARVRLGINHSIFKRFGAPPGR